MRLHSENITMWENKRIQDEIRTTQKGTIETLKKMLFNHDKTYKAVKREYNRKLAVFTSIAFILGTIFFMIISKSK